MNKYYIQFKADNKSDSINIVASNFERVINFIKNNNFNNELIKIENIVYVSEDNDVYIAE